MNIELTKDAIVCDGCAKELVEPHMARGVFHFCGEYCIDYFIENVCEEFKDLVEKKEGEEK